MCNCIRRINGLMAERNGRLVLGFVHQDTRLRAMPVVWVEKINPRGKRPASLAPSFCPFCGEKYPNTDCAPESENYRLRTANAELLAALKTVEPYLTQTEAAGLVGDEGAHWPVEIVRAALANARGEG